ncbi:MAG: hypothetical protein ACOY42_11900 [Pseudomonadota bacterium]|jgi:hypothetical protein
MNKIVSETLSTLILAAVGLGGWAYVLAVLSAAFDARTVVA